MRCREEGTDRYAKVSMSIALKRAKEYGEFIDKDGAICSYVVADVTKDVSLCPVFAGTTTQFCIDVFVDGVFRNFYKSPKKTAPKTCKEIKRQISTGYSQNYTQLHSKSMTMIPLKSGPESEDRNTTVVGVIEIRFSVVRRAEATHTLEVADPYIGLDEEDIEYATSDTCCDPTHQIKFVRNKTSALTRHAKASRLQAAHESRPGPKPWAVFKYFYRSKEAIKKAGFQEPKSRLGYDNVLDLDRVSLSDLTPLIQPMFAGKTDSSETTGWKPPTECGTNRTSYFTKSEMDLDLRPPRDHRTAKPDTRTNASGLQSSDIGIPRCSSSHKTPNKRNDHKSTRSVENQGLLSTAFSCVRMGKADSSRKEGSLPRVNVDSVLCSSTEAQLKAPEIPTTPPTSDRAILAKATSKHSTVPSLPTESPNKTETLKRRPSHEISSPTKRSQTTPAVDDLRKQIAEQKERSSKAQERLKNLRTALDRKRIAKLKKDFEQAQQEEHDFDKEAMELEAELRELTDSEMDV